MKTCTKCVLTEKFPGITFNETGVCNFCSNYSGAEQASEEKKIYRAKFDDLLKEIQGKTDYDCTLSYSGGKDSTYTLYVLREIFKLKVLALTFDNGFISEQAFANIRTMSEKLGCDSLIFKADFGLLRKVFDNAINKEMYSPKTLERASTICTSCIGLAKFIFLKIALEKRIPLMAWGWTPGQAPIRSSIMKINPMLFKSTQEALRVPMEKAAGGAINRFFLTDEQFKNASIFPYNVSPLAFMDYDENDIFKNIKTLGWVSPQEVDANSTNCLLNSFANRIHIEKYGFHPYAFEIAGMVRSGVMKREEGLKKLEEDENIQTVGYVKNKLGI
jgi:hypothetical protein